MSRSSVALIALGVAIMIGGAIFDRTQPLVVSQCRGLVTGQDTSSLEVLYSETLPACIMAAKPDTPEIEIEELKQVGQDLKDQSTYSPIAASARESAVLQVRQITASSIAWQQTVWVVILILGSIPLTMVFVWWQLY